MTTHPAVEALRSALALATRCVEEVSASGDDAAALACVIELDEALEELPALHRAVTALIGLASPGPEAGEHVSGRAAQASDIAAGLGSLRTALSTASQHEAELQALLAERSSLRDKITALRRLERLSTALGELEGQRQLIDDRLKALRQPVEKAEIAVLRGAVDLVRLTDERREALLPRVRESLDQAAAAQSALADVEAELTRHRTDRAEAARRHEELTTLHREGIAAMRAQAAANLRVAEALGAPGGDGLSQVAEVVRDVQTRLAEVDGVLATALDTRQAEGVRAKVHANR
ncbi:hypothetical protein SAMN04488564_102610 [Lentzea waywayandensis]|uniref:Uncharacterized protein n=1 Tax=Lentzea waywayandensis TaxID=84724 RepID=A0A1I6DHB6_9PSEU|nr:hypothetical protein [Lentzea waywayandensis]SFR04778.1 hypothetical protein SAMN04488564_102610 [Lentzea waywayandensis]